MSGRNTSGPLLTTLSNYQSSPKWSIRHDGSQKEDPAANCRDQLPGPAAYNPTSCVDKTSKFRKIASSCAFNNSKRFPSDSSKLVLAHAPPGPGAYDPPLGFLFVSSPFDGKRHIFETNSLFSGTEPDSRCIEYL